ncbi:hypothetical protein Hanom_Chr00s157481g01824081 [Helianthus anomalus]
MTTTPHLQPPTSPLHLHSCYKTPITAAQTFSPHHCCRKRRGAPLPLLPGVWVCVGDGIGRQRRIGCECGRRIRNDRGREMVVDGGVTRS